MSKRRKERLGRVVLVALTLCLLGGCGVAPYLWEAYDYDYTPTPEELLLLEQYSVDRTPVDFSQLTYTRPDTTAMEREMREYIRGIRRSRSLEEALGYMESARVLLDDYLTMRGISNIRSDMDYYDDSWYDEYLFCEDSYYIYSSLWNEVYWELLDSRYGGHLLPLWDATWDEPYPISSDAGKSDDLFQEISDIADYAAYLIDYATVTYRGEEIDLYDAYDLEDWQDACEAWYRAYGEELLDLYTEMVGYCSELARDCYGVDSYTDYIFQYHLRDYTPAMAAALIDGIVEHILPLDELIDYDYWTDSGDFGDFDHCIAVSRRVLESMDPAMAQALEMMLDYGLYFTEDTDYYVRPYVIYLPSPNLPFLFSPYYDDNESALSFTHEFGHFYEGYISRENFSLYDDLSEVHSQAMSLLFAQRYQELYGDGALLDHTLRSIADTLITQSFNASIEMRVYDLPAEEITAKRIGQIAKEQSLLYGQQEEHGMFLAYYWLTDSELFTDPLQPLCYTVSAGAALELWRTSLTDMELALERYDRLVRHPGDFRFLSNLEAAGVASPFDTGWCRETAVFLEQWLTGGAENAAA